MLSLLSRQLSTLSTSCLLPLTLASLLVVLTGADAAQRGQAEQTPYPYLKPHSSRPGSDLSQPNVRRSTDGTAGTAPASVNIPLNRRVSHKSLKESDYGSWARRQADWLVAKYSGRSTDQLPSVRRSSGSTYLLNQNTDSSFYASIGLGTPPTSYNVIIDTGSSDLWVAGRTCETGCDGVPQYDGANSSTFESLSIPFTITYGSASAQGVLVKDTVQMGGYEVEDQTFAVAESVSRRLLSSPVSGLMGLAFPGIAASGSTPFWMRLAASGSWDKPLMSLVLTKFLGVDGAEALEPGGVLTFGALNETLHTGQVDYTSVPTGTRNYWQLPLTNFTVQGTPVPLPTGPESYAAIDTGTTLIGAPSAVIDQIAALVPGSSPGDGEFTNYIYYPCDSEVTVTFSFGSRVWVIGPQDFELLHVRNDTCVSAFFRLTAGGTTPKWIIGDTFLKNVYSVFQYEPPAIGFANLSDVALSMSSVTNPLPSPSLGATIVITGSGASSTRFPNSMLHGIHGILAVFIIILLVYPL